MPQDRCKAMGKSQEMQSVFIVVAIPLACIAPLEAIHCVSRLENKRAIGGHDFAETLSGRECHCFSLFFIVRVI